MDYSVELTTKPTPGIGYIPNVTIGGHNIEYCNLADFTTVPNEYFEFLTYVSDGIQRIVVNKVLFKLVVVYTSSSIIYEYTDVPMSIIKQLEENVSKSTLIAEVKNACPVHTLEHFPEAVLTNLSYYLKNN